MFVCLKSGFVACGMCALWSVSAVAGDVPCIFPELEGAYDTAGTARASVIDGSYAYVADGNAGVTALDISDLSNPTLSDSFDTAGNGLDLRLVGDRVYLADDTAGLVVFDVSVAGTLTMLGGVDTAGRAFGIDVVGTTVYIADRENGLLVFDASDPGSIALLGQYTIPGAFVLDVVVNGSLAYLAVGNGGGFEIVDVSTPAAMSLVGGLPTSGISVDHHGSIVYLADAVNGLAVIDAGVPSAPDLLRGMELGSSRSVTAQGALVFVGNNTDGMVIVDASVPIVPRVIGEYDTPGSVLGVGVTGSIACIGDFFSGVQFVDLNASACEADLSGDCVLDFFDVSQFLTMFGSGDFDADMNGDGLFDFFDVSAFLTSFSAGCP